MMRLILILILLLTCCAGCKKQKKFIIGKNGIEYKIFSDKNGRQIHYKDYLAVFIKRYYNDSLLGTPHDSIIRIVRVDSGSVLPGYVDALLNARTKDSILTRILADSLLKKDDPPPYAKRGNYFQTTIKILSIIDDSLMAYIYQNDAEVRIHRIDSILKHSQQIIDDSILTKATIGNNKIIKTAHGVYVQVIKKGSGKIISKGNRITIDYNSYTIKNKFIDGSYDSTGKSILPLKFTVGDLEVIPGLEEGIQLFKGGGEGKIYIPSSLAFGMGGIANKVNPGECVYFNIHILRVE